MLTSQSNTVNGGICGSHCFFFGMIHPPLLLIGLALHTEAVPLHMNPPWTSCAEDYELVLVWIIWLSPCFPLGRFAKQTAASPAGARKLCAAVFSVNTQGSKLFLSMSLVKAEQTDQVYAGRASWTWGIITDTSRTNLQLACSGRDSPPCGNRPVSSLPETFQQGGAALEKRRPQEAEWARQAEVLLLLDLGRSPDLVCVFQLDMFTHIVHRTCNLLAQKLLHEITDCNSNQHSHTKNNTWLIFFLF